MTSFSSVQISSASERKETWNFIHFFNVLGHPVSENFVSWCQILKKSSASFLCIQETYIISTISKEIQKCVICVWCLDNWSWVLSGKPFNTFSIARLTKLQFRLTLTPLLTAMHVFCFSLLFLWSVIAVVWVSSAVVFLLFSWPSIYVSYWFTVICEILKNVKF